MKKKKSKLLAEFKTFITRGNVIDMSVGIIIGGAFTAIVNGLSNNILKPIINWFISLVTGKDSLSDIYTYLDIAYDVYGDIDLSQSIYIDWGAFINAIISFFLIAVVLFSIIKVINLLNETSKKITDIKNTIAYKQAHNIKLTKKEVKFLEAQKIKEAEEKAKAEEEARKKAEEEAKLTRSEALLTEIVELLKEKK